MVTQRYILAVLLVIYSSLLHCDDGDIYFSIKIGVPVHKEPNSESVIVNSLSYGENYWSTKTYYSELRSTWYYIDGLMNKGWVNSDNLVDETVFHAVKEWPFRYFEESFGDVLFQTWFSKDGKIIKYTVDGVVELDINGGLGKNRPLLYKYRDIIGIADNPGGPINSYVLYNKEKKWLCPVGYSEIDSCKKYLEDNRSLWIFELYRN